MMHLGDFSGGVTVAVKDLTADDAFWGGDAGDELFVPVFGLPDPDPSTKLVMRLMDNYISGIGADVQVETVCGEFGPMPCSSASSSPPSPAGAKAHEPAAARPAPSGPAPSPAAHGHAATPAPGKPAPTPTPPPAPRRGGRR